MISFGTGRLFATTQEGTPIEFGELQDISVGFSWEKKELPGAMQFSQKIARGKGKIECKAKFAEIRAAAVNLILGGTVLTGRKRVATELITVDKTGLATVEFGAKFVTNLGVYDVSNSKIAVPMTLVAAAPANASEYNLDVVTGKYTFHTSMANKAVMINYKYAVSTGKTIRIDNKPMGEAPTFQVDLSNCADHTGIGLYLTCCMSSKLDLAFKNGDFVIPDFDFSASSDATGSPGELYLDE